MASDESMADHVFPVERPPPQDPTFVAAARQWLADQARAAGRGIQRAGQTMADTLPAEVQGGLEDVQRGLAHTSRGASDYLRAPLTESGYPNVRGIAGGAAKTALGAGRVAGAGATALARGVTEAPLAIREEMTGQPRSPEAESARQAVEQFIAGTVPVTLGAGALLRVPMARVRGSQGGYVHITHDSNTGLPTGFRAGPGPPQRALPPGSVEAPATLSGSVSGRPGQTAHVGWMGGELSPSRLPGRYERGGTERGPGLAAGREMTDEAVNAFKDRGYIGVDFNPLTSHLSDAEVALARRSGLSTDIGQESRLWRNEIGMGGGNKAVRTPQGDYKIPFPEVAPTPPPWYEKPAPRTPEQERWEPSVPPAQAQRNYEALLADSKRMGDLIQANRQGGMDRVEARRVAEATLDRERRGLPPRQRVTQPAAGMSDPVDRLHELITLQHPQSTLTRTQVRALSNEYRDTVGHAPTDPADLQDFALRTGYVSQADLDRMLGPATTTTEQGLRQGTTPSMPAPPSQARVQAGRDAALARREAESAASFQARSHRGYDLTPGQAELIQRVQERQGGRMAADTERAQRQAERASGQQSLFGRGGVEPTRQSRAAEPIEPTGGPSARSGGAPLTPDQALEVDRQYRIRQRQRAGALNRAEAAGRGQRLDIGPPDLSTEAGRISAREEYLAGELNLRPDQLAEVFPNETMRAAAMRARESRARRRGSLNAARHADIAHLSDAAQDRVADWGRRFREAEGHDPTRADLARYLDEQGWPYRHEGE